MEGVRKTDRQTERQTGIYSQRKRDWETDRQRQRENE